MTGEGRPKRELTEEEIEESLRFGDGASAAAGHFVDDPESREDTREYLRGNMTWDQLHDRLLRRVMGPDWTPPDSDERDDVTDQAEDASPGEDQSDPAVAAAARDVDAQAEYDTSPRLREMLRHAAASPSVTRVYRRRRTPWVAGLRAAAGEAEVDAIRLRAAADAAADPDQLAAALAAVAEARGATAAELVAAGPDELTVDELQDLVQRLLDSADDETAHLVRSRANARLLLINTADRRDRVAEAAARVSEISTELDQRLAPTEGPEFDPTHPGEILREFLPVLLADAMETSPESVAELLAGRRSVTQEESVQLGEVFGQSDEFWLNLQVAYDRDRERFDHMPPLAERASTKTTVKWIDLLRTSLPTSDVAKILGVGNSRVRQRVADRGLYAVRRGTGWAFPAFQFVDGHEVPGWEKVAPHIPTDEHLVAVHNLMTQPHVDLTPGDGKDPLSPIQWLSEGNPVQPVIDLVDGAFARRG